MSLYDDLDGVPLQSSSEDVGKLSGWSNSLKLMQTQLHRKKVIQNKPVFPTTKSKSLTPSLLGKGLQKKLIVEEKDFGTEEISHGDLHTVPEPFIETDASLAMIEDEYDPLKPNDYEVVKEKIREKRERDRREERDRERDVRMRERFEREQEKDRERDRDKERPRERRREGRRDDDDYHRPSSRRSVGAAIAPPSSLLESEPIVPQKEPDPSIDGRPLVTGDKEKTDLGFAVNAVASSIMAKYGWKDGQGLGKSEQGINTCLQVEKTSKRGGKIINQEKEAAKSQAEGDSLVGAMKNPSKVVLLRNMVGPGEVDDDLQPETAEECAKYGEVVKVIIYEIPVGAPDDEAVRIFVEFTRMESAIKAVVDLNGRYFGGRTVKANFFNLDKFRRLDLADDN
ncbi:predicted protein [Nematostella vectensis]|uniref:Splicing factor 45 n=1 Tax=Nematostella vectensis TaxID=45351 RepID=A7S8H1_NEMVE|nr:predicted protein [Nematostella vectensis]|eukprot:XP_001632048.1 predicted protein [Nematostella vectensis]